MTFCTGCWNCPHIYFHTSIQVFILSWSIEDRKCSNLGIEICMEKLFVTQRIQISNALPSCHPFQNSSRMFWKHHECIVMGSKIRHIFIELIICENNQAKRTGFRQNFSLNTDQTRRERENERFHNIHLDQGIAMRYSPLQKFL